MRIIMFYPSDDATAHANIARAIRDVYARASVAVFDGPLRCTVESNDPRLDGARATDCEGIAMRAGGVETRGL